MWSSLQRQETGTGAYGDVIKSCLVAARVNGGPDLTVTLLGLPVQGHAGAMASAGNVSGGGGGPAEAAGPGRRTREEAGRPDPQVGRRRHRDFTNTPPAISAPPPRWSLTPQNTQISIRFRNFLPVEGFIFTTHDGTESPGLSGRCGGQRKHGVTGAAVEGRHSSWHLCNLRKRPAFFFPAENKHQRLLHTSLKTARGMWRGAAVRWG